VAASAPGPARAATPELVDTFSVGYFPFALAVSPDGGTLYVANAGDGTTTRAPSRSSELADTGLDAGSTAAGLGLIAMGMLALVVHRVARARQRTENALRG
jgi:sugar lactone lactonase YvrE